MNIAAIPKNTRPGMKLETRWFCVGVYSLLATLLTVFASVLAQIGDPHFDDLASFAFALVAPTAITAVVIANGASKVSLLASFAAFAAVGLLYFLDITGHIGWLGYGIAGAIVLISVTFEYWYKNRAAGSSSQVAPGIKLASSDGGHIAE
ncbi:hypothetical protein KIV56_17225 [Cryobacterium breve]|uniref:Uncharacterized protein n=1 Tax=Cryobacterium breve TaxID=1259258 RepID=A0ABY7ND10_9MICO|nr:hypothetical protein [Cryobacterium breve]WBM79887.1 hypothetical protein KIV56_17225 [Cryobacterium breve]